MFKPTKIESSVKLTFGQREIQNSILEDLNMQGFLVTSRAWNETNTKFEVTALKPEAKTNAKGGK